jgi:two-component system response regulator HydG
LPVLIAHFAKELAARYGKPTPAVAEPVRKAFAGYDWPGNVRELRNVLESMVVLDADGVLGWDDLPDDAGPAKGGVEPVPTGADGLVGRPLADVERYYIEAALTLTAGNREEAARRLGIGERTLYRKLQEWKKDGDAG